MTYAADARLASNNGAAVEATAAVGVMFVVGTDSVEMGCTNASAQSAVFCPVHRDRLAGSAACRIP